MNKRPQKELNKKKTFFKEVEFCNFFLYLMFDGECCCRTKGIITRILKKNQVDL